MASTPGAGSLATQDAGGQPVAARNSRELRRRTTDEKASDWVRYHCKGWTRNSTHVAGKDGQSMLKRVAQDMRDARTNPQPDGPGTAAYKSRILDVYRPDVDPKKQLVPKVASVVDPALVSALVKTQLKKGKEYASLDAYLSLAGAKPNESEVCGIFRAALDLNPELFRARINSSMISTIIRRLSRTNKRSRPALM